MIRPSSARNPAIGYMGFVPGVVSNNVFGTREYDGYMQACQRPQSARLARSEVGRSRAIVDFAIQVKDAGDEREKQRMLKAHRVWPEQQVHGHWRRGVIGYSGYFPHWVRDKMLMNLKRELGKPFPPYLPIVTHH